VEFDADTMFAQISRGFVASNIQETEYAALLSAGAGSNFQFNRMESIFGPDLSRNLRLRAHWIVSFNPRQIRRFTMSANDDR
jgi:hypothetical protein